MQRSSSLFHTIEQYLANTLSKDEKITFENAIATDEALRLEVERHKVLSDILRQKGLITLKEELQQIHQEIIEEEQAEKRQKRFLYLKIAAVFVLCIGLGGVLWNSIFGTATTEELYALYYSPYPVSEVRTVIDPEQEKLMINYQQQIYTEVVKIYENNTISQLSGESQIYIGISYLELDRTKKAIDIFKSMSPKSGYYEDALWYLSLTYLHLGDTKNCIHMLQDIIRYEGRYIDKAKSLQKKVKSLK